MIMRRWLIWIPAFLLLGGCASFHKTKPLDFLSKERVSKPQYARYVSVTRSLPPFVNVNIKLPVNVKLHTGCRTSEVILSGDAHDIPRIGTTVRKQTLYVTLGSLKPHMTKKKIVYGPVEIDICMSTIHQFIYRGKGRVVGQNITSNAMEVMLNNSGSTRFEGQINLRKLTIVGAGYTEINGIQSDYLAVYLHGRPKVQLTGVANMDIVALGAPKMSFYWLKAPLFKLRAKGGGGIIQMGGIADRLDVELDGNIRFDGRYIRAKETFVKTHGHAIAYISTALYQHTLAMDASDIYYYTLPLTNSNFMAKNGAVLDMRSWELQLEQPFSSYNKSS